MTLKVDNQQLWDSLIETGILNGFSIEGNFEREQITATEFSDIKENHKYMDKKEKNVITAIREVFTGKDEVVEASEQDGVIEEETAAYILSPEEQEIILKFREDTSEAPAEAPAEIVEEEVEASAEVVETEVAEVETPEVVAEVAEVETPAVTTIEEVVEVIESKEKDEVPMVPHTDTQVRRKVKLEFDSKLTVQDRIKRNLEINLQ
jgi:hypothetical protein